MTGETVVLKRREKEELRCECGNLVARLVEDGLEIKCRRCKRILVIPITLTKEVTEMSAFRLDILVVLW